MITARWLSDGVVSDSRGALELVHKQRAAVTPAVRFCSPSIMSKAVLLVFACVLFSCLAGPHSVESWLRERVGKWRPRGCGDRLAASEACGANSTELAAHPRDCRLFFYCRGAARPICRRCPFGLHFNPELSVCDWPQNANCTVRPPPHPRPRPSTNPTSTNASASTSAVSGSTPTPEPSSSSVAPDATTHSTDLPTSTNVVTDTPTSPTTGA